VFQLARPALSGRRDWALRGNRLALHVWKSNPFYLSGELQDISLIQLCSAALRFRNSFFCFGFLRIHIAMCFLCDTQSFVSSDPHRSHNAKITGGSVEPAVVTANLAAGHGDQCPWKIERRERDKEIAMDARMSRQKTAIKGRMADSQFAEWLMAIVRRIFSPLKRTGFVELLKIKLASFQCGMMES
jgi:hypothetical protein